MASIKKLDDKVTEKAPKFTKEQLIQSKSFGVNKDVAMAVLREEKTYTKEQASSLVLDFLNRKV